MVKNRNAILAALLCVFLAAVGCGAQNTGGQASDIAYFANMYAPVSDWDPASAAGVEPQVFLNTYETLLKYSPKEDAFEPVLATDYELSEDGLEWTFQLREGIRFHDGTEFNAQAVKWNVDRTKAINQGSAYIWDTVKEIEVVDDYTVRFHCSSVTAVDLIVSCAFAAYMASPTAAGDDLNASREWFAEGNICGTGPYKLFSQVQGDEVILTKNEEYWKGWDGSHFDKVVIKYIGETAPRRQMLESGEADIVAGLMAGDLEAVKKNPDVKILVYDSYENMLGLLNTVKPPLDNKLVRQAICYAFPYQEVIDYVKLGYASLAKDFIPANMWGANEGEPYYTRDLEKAKELLTQAGYPDGGFTLTYTYMGGNEDRKKTAELYKAELAKLGITLDIQGMQWDSMTALAKASDPNNRQDIINFKQWNDIVTPMAWYESMVKTEKEILWNYSYYSNPKVDAMIEEAHTLTATDREEAAEIFRQAGRIVADDCIAIYQGDERGVMCLNKRFQGFKPNEAYKDVIFFYDCYRAE